MDSLVLWVALSPKQRDDLNRGGVVYPDTPPGKFHLCVKCSSEKTSVQYQMSPLDCSYWDFSVLQIEISSRAYLQKMESGTLERIRQGEYWWHGSLQREQMDLQGQVLYHFLAER